MLDSECRPGCHRAPSTCEEVLGPSPPRSSKILAFCELWPSVRRSQDVYHSPTEVAATMVRRVSRLGLLFCRYVHSSPSRRGSDWPGDLRPKDYGPHAKRENRFLARLPILFLGFMPIVCAGLGTWQIHRLQWKVHLIEDLHDKLSRDPMSLPRNVKWAATFILQNSTH